MMSTTKYELRTGRLAPNPLSDPGRYNADPAEVRPARLGDVHDAISQLRDLGSVDDALAAAARTFAPAGHFARVLLSRIEGSLWVPRHWHSSELEHERERGLESLLAALRVPLCSTMVETQVVRRRTSQRVEHAQTDSRMHQPFVDAIRTCSYIVAPVIVGEEAVALIHADHGANRHPVSEADHDIVRHFADLLGLALESIALDARIAAEREQVRSALARAESVLSQKGTPSLSVVLNAPTPAPHALQPASHPWGLSDREAEVLALMAEGLTNRGIADRLFVSESTVKSHVKQIFRKQGASTRSESIAHAWRHTRWQELRAS